MRVSGPYRAGAVKGKPSRRSGGGSAFSLDAEVPAVSATSAAASATGVQGLEALLALQGVDDPTAQKRGAIKRGFSILDSLDALRADLLAGRVPAERIEQLLTNLRLDAPSGDSALDSLVEEIELRARVELAKLGRFP